MKLFLFEPQPNLAIRIGAAREARVVGSADSLAVVQPQLPAHDFILVSAAFPWNEISRFLSEHPHHAGRTVVVEIQEEPTEILPFLEAGAAGYVRREANMSELLVTLREIRSGKTPLAPPIGDALLNRMHELLRLQKQRNAALLPTDSAAFEALTLRERQVLTLICNGASNQEIANQLMIQLGTVKNHVHNILKKLNVPRREHAAQYVNLLEQIN